MNLMHMMVPPLSVVKYDQDIQAAVALTDHAVSLYADAIRQSN